MRNCTKCGGQIMEEFIICPKCGCSTGFSERMNSGSTLATKIFLVLGCILNVLLFSLFLSAGNIVASVIYALSLAWCLPMTMYYFSAIKHNNKIGMVFKICVLLLVSLIAGIILIVDDIVEFFN